MIDPELKAELDAIYQKAAEAADSANKARSYLFWTGVITVALIVLPAIGLAFVIPSYVTQIQDQVNGVGL
jgi:hypothetical protein